MMKWCERQTQSFIVKDNHFPCLFLNTTFSYPSLYSILWQVDNIFSNLATYTALYGRSPFSPGTYPRAVIVRTTPPTTTTTTTSTTTTTTTTKSTTTTTNEMLSDRFFWGQIDNRHVLPSRGDGIIPEYQYVEDETQGDETKNNHQELEATRIQPSSSDIKEGSLRLVGGHDNSEVIRNPKSRTPIVIQTIGFWIIFLVIDM